MKVLAIDCGSNFLDFLMRCQNYGHQVKWFDRKRKDGTPRLAGKGIIEKIDDLEELRKKWLGWADLIVVADNIYLMEFLDPYRKLGYPIFGPSPEAAKMELDRLHGQKCMKDAGIPILESKTFHDYGSAIKFVEKNPEMLVSKPSGDANKALSYVAHDSADLCYMLERWGQRPDLVTAAKEEGFLIQEKVKGIEMAVGGWFGPGGWSKNIWENWEYKKLMAMDLGPATGEMGTLGRYVSKSKLADKVLFPITDYLKEIGYVGYVDNNCMIDEKGQPWPMEWTMRPGWPNFHNQICVHQGDPARWMLDLIDGKDTLEVSKEVTISLVMAIPDFPYSKLTNKEVSGIPVYGATDFDHIHWSEIMIGKDVPVFIDGKVVRMAHPVTAGDYVLVCTGTGSTITGARKSAYTAIKKVRMPASPFYRPDIGKGRMVPQLPQLHALGYATGLEF
jgi:phosphoribosylamine--glycine ligase